MTTTQPITVWLTTNTTTQPRAPTHGRSEPPPPPRTQPPTNPGDFQVITILEELTIPYTIKCLHPNELKKRPFTTINPNSRVPAIHDPSTNLTLWESSAITQYLIDTYDIQKRLTYEDLPRKHLLNQYLHFQSSGQGPYFEQCGWFSIHHPEHIPSAITRYKTEVHRILSVLDTVLEGREWLVGEKCTYADLAFLTWNAQLRNLVPRGADEDERKYPWVERWQERMEGREAWRRVVEALIY
ncbi:glutathione S-transferase [Aspergillus ellipticus CBS 707.79]|uniref:glutathione transferase n=1 Tax=Aspergillus ellipticus CBS 707.79 TaxID=1448320 RepID=A0A319E2W0_9EURO|nr:glutathione S-transferase [Aspergillus ellipticus CBS 707.79]